MRYGVFETKSIRRHHTEFNCTRIKKIVDLFGPNYRSPAIDKIRTISINRVTSLEYGIRSSNRRQSLRIDDLISYSIITRKLRKYSEFQYHRININRLRHERHADWKVQRILWRSCQNAEKYKKITKNTHWLYKNHQNLKSRSSN